MNSPEGVLLLAHRLDLGGSERQLTEVAKALDRDCFAPHVGCFHPGGIRGEELRASGVPILHLPVTSFASPSALRGGLSLVRYIREHNIRLVHSFDVPLNIFGVPFARLAHQPAVLSSQRAHRNLTPGMYTQLLRLTDRMVDGIVVNCLHMRDHLIADEHVDPGMIHLCYNGIDFSVFHREERATAGMTIGVICALRPEKGLLTLIRAFGQIHERYPEAKLVIVGSGPMLPQLEAEAELLGVKPGCTFVPTTSDVAQWLRRIDIFVLPSLSEALSNSLMEAMACGCCCVASRRGRQSRTDGRDYGRSEGENIRGLLFPKEDSRALAEALVRLLGDANLREQLSDAGYRFIRAGFSQEQSVSCMETIYRTFLSPWSP